MGGLLVPIGSGDFGEEELNKGETTDDSYLNRASGGCETHDYYIHRSTTMPLAVAA